MDQQILYIIIGIIILINVFFMFVMISRKKNGPSPNQTVKQSNERENSPVDEHEKTEVLGRKRKASPASSKQSSIETEMDHNISNFTSEERHAIKSNSYSPSNETLLLVNNDNATQLLVPESPPSYLRYVDNGETKELLIDKERTVIGREQGACDLTLLNDNFVGRTHAILYKKEDKFFFTDLNSKNGTFINNEPLKGQLEIFYETKIRVGKTELELIKK